MWIEICASAPVMPAAARTRPTSRGEDPRQKVCEHERAAGGGEVGTQRALLLIRSVVVILVDRADGRLDPVHSGDRDFDG